MLVNSKKYVSQFPGRLLQNISVPSSRMQNPFLNGLFDAQCVVNCVFQSTWQRSERCVVSRSIDSMLMAFRPRSVAVRAKAFHTTVAALKPSAPAIFKDSEDATGCIPQVPKQSAGQPKKATKELPSRSVKGPAFKIPSPHDLGLHHLLKPFRPLINPLVDTLAKVLCGLQLYCLASSIYLYEMSGRAAAEGFSAAAEGLARRRRAPI